jgi:bifunctional DNA-binding transcriptional regulator/antitoxin component of YhaV-PrlF toxin-antitoxin module
MPQLVKGGKYAYAWSKVDKNGKITIPKEAIEEYNLVNCEKLILISGSKRSGGFGLTTAELLQNSMLRIILNNTPQLANYQSPEGEAIDFKGKTVCWVKMNTDGSIVVPLETLRNYGIRQGDRLLSVRGSRFALGFIVRGPIIEEAKKHEDLEIFE